MSTKSDSDVREKEPNGVDVVATETATSLPTQQLKRQLKNRHVAMIRFVLPLCACGSCLTLSTSIGGVIGTGLFLGTASALQEGGPVGLLLGYILIGAVCYCVMVNEFEHKSCPDLNSMLPFRYLSAR